MSLVIEQTPCIKCGAEDATNICSVCKGVSYCDDICGHEDWEEHLAECNVLVGNSHVDYIIVPEGFEMTEDSPDLIIQCPNAEGTATVEYALSEIGLKQSEKDLFFGSTEKKSRLGGVSLNFNNKNIGTTYGFTVSVTDYKTGDPDGDSLTVSGLNLEADIRERDDLGARETPPMVVLTPNLKEAIARDPNANDVDIDTDRSVNIHIQLFQEKVIDGDTMRKIVFNVKGMMPKGAIFTNDNAVKSLARRARRLFTFRKNRTSRTSALYKSKMQDSFEDVKVAIVFSKAKDQSTATIEDIYFKVPPKLFRDGKWATPSSLGALETEDGPLSAAKIASEIDPCDLVDVTALCFDLEHRIETLGEMIKDEEADAYKREYVKHQSRAQHYLAVLKPHQAELYAGIGDEFEPSYKVSTTIDAALELEHIDGFLTKMNERHQATWYTKLLSEEASVPELIEEGKDYVLFLKPSVAQDPKFAPLWPDAIDAAGASEGGGKKAAILAWFKKAGKGLAKKFSGRRGKIKARARAVAQRLKILTRNIKAGTDTDKARGALLVLALRKATTTFK